jgi:phosphonatase-like hydrolase
MLKATLRSHILAGMTTCRLAVLDIAGTTIVDRDHVARALVLAMEGAGLGISVEEANGVMGMPKPIAIGMLAKERHHVVDVGSVFADFESHMKRLYREDPDLAPIPGAEEAIAQLRNAGVLVGLDTGFSRAIADLVLERVGWQSGIVDASIASDEVDRGRPFPDMILRLMERFDVADPAAVAKAGDTPADLRQGHAAGCGWVVGVLSGTHSREQLATEPHTHLMDSVAELPGLLLG